MICLNILATVNSNIQMKTTHVKQVWIKNMNLYKVNIIVVNVL